MLSLRATTVIAVRRDGQVAMAGDGQITMGDTVMKNSAVKIRTMYRGQVLAGFAGAVADALALFDRFETQLDRSAGNLRKAAVDLAKDWRTDRYLRRLEAQLVLADGATLLLVSGDGEVIEPDNDVVAIGSGGQYAMAAAQALMRHTTLSAAELARAAMEVAASICIYTNDNITLHCVDGTQPAEAAKGGTSD
ncbi:MAG TPA: HslU--HslV peptidase proteolytic subunit [Chloroflexi bacterium]|jgi:ATP-dependent HslUV protease subunit HslV|nr:HslU--HslV peptidase proteolytic subunit [Chloroflexota bacterium]